MKTINHFASPGAGPFFFSLFFLLSAFLRAFRSVRSSFLDVYGLSNLLGSRAGTGPIAFFSFSSSFRAKSVTVALSLSIFTRLPKWKCVFYSGESRDERGSWGIQIVQAKTFVLPSCSNPLDSPKHRLGLTCRKVTH